MRPRRVFWSEPLPDEVNLVNAPVIMRNRGIQVEVATTSEARGYAGAGNLSSGH